MVAVPQPVTCPIPPTGPVEAQRDAWRLVIEPARATAQAAFGRMPDHTDPWAVPRAGLGTGVAVLVARGFGTRRWQEAMRVAAVALEGWNQRVHADPSASRNQWLGADAARVRRVWQALHRRDAALLDRVVLRATAGPDLGDAALPETVIFLRGAVAAGVLCGDVPDPAHVALDRWATFAALAWEAHLGTLTPEGWRAALHAIGLDRPWPDSPAAVARDEALLALRSLADGDPVERLEAATAALGAPEPDARTFPAWIPRLAPPARQAVDRAEAVEAALAEVVADGSRVFRRATAYLLGQGGKRVRPLLVLAAAEACGADPATALRPAALVEWLHQASLVLDDIVDEARVRRNGPTLHHATSEPFAVGAALFVLARVRSGSADLPAPVRGAIAEAAAALADGQHTELAHTGDDQLPLATYYRIIEAKTARLFGCAATIGARCANAPERRVAALGRYGREIGLAFQVVDDVLDYTGDEATFGKRPGTDLRARKVTLPLLLLRDRLDAAGRERLATVLRDPDPERLRDAFDGVRDQILALGVHDDCLARARTHRARAEEALEALPAGPGRDELASLADRLVERRR